MGYPLGFFNASESQQSQQTKWISENKERKEKQNNKYFSKAIIP